MHARTHTDKNYLFVWLLMHPRLLHFLITFVSVSLTIRWEVTTGFTQPFTDFLSKSSGEIRLYSSFKTHSIKIQQAGYILYITNVPLYFTCATFPWNLIRVTTCRISVTRENETCSSLSDSVVRQLTKLTSCISGNMCHNHARSEL